ETLLKKVKEVQIASVVLDYGGDIIKFLGDAVLVTFPPWHSGEANSLLQSRAVDCCAQILRSHGEYRVDLRKWKMSYKSSTPVIRYATKSRSADRRMSVADDDSVKLGVHIGLTFGRTAHVVVGSSRSRLDYFITGECLLELERLLEEATVGELAVSKSYISRFEENAIPSESNYAILKFSAMSLSLLGIPPELAGKDLRLYYSIRHIPSCPDDDELLPLFVNESINYRLKLAAEPSNMIDFKLLLNEYRSLSILFVKFLHEPSFPELQEIAVIFFSILEEYSGVFQQFTMDDKGCVVCNTAARLLGISKLNNTIAIDNETYEAIKNEYCNLKDLGCFKLKGRVEPMQVWGAEPETFSRKKKNSDYLDTSFIGNREELEELEEAFRSWQMKSTKEAISLFELLLNIEGSIKVDELGHAVSRTIREMNEETIHIPLIMEWLVPGRGKKFFGAAAADAKWTAQRLILSSLAVKLICKLLENQRFCFLFDDFQWLDIASLEALISVAKQSKCERALSVENINEKIITAVYAKTHGILLQVDIITSFLKDNPEILYENLDETEEMLDSILSKSVEAVIITQFDRLDSLFQIILRCASIVGHYVEISLLKLLVQAAEETRDISIDDIRSTILKSDKFSFFNVPEGSGEFTNVDFRHIAIKNAIYESMALVFRQQLHLKLANYFESVATEEDVKNYLPLMCYHYWRSGNVSKLVVKNIEFGLSLASDGNRVEATSVLSAVFDFMDEKCERKETRSILSAELEAKALAKLTFSSALNAPLELTRNFAIRAFEMLSGPWPKKQISLRLRVIQNLFLIFYLLLKTSNGRRDAPRKKKDGLNSIRHESLLEILGALVQVSAYDGNNTGPSPGNKYSTYRSITNQLRIFSIRMVAQATILNKFRSSPMSGLEQLPLELAQAIVLYINPTEVPDLSLVSRSYRNVFHLPSNEDGITFAASHIRFQIGSFDFHKLSKTYALGAISALGLSPALLSRLFPNGFWREGSRQTSTGLIFGGLRPKRNSNAIAELLSEAVRLKIVNLSEERHCSLLMEVTAFLDAAGLARVILDLSITTGGCTRERIARRLNERAYKHVAIKVLTVLSELEFEEQTEPFENLSAHWLAV
ncbi:Adenylate cyclase type 10, partial [Phlyctochytrium bullatum]